jgi:hypothetical protein
MEFGESIRFVRFAKENNYPRVKGYSISVVKLALHMQENDPGLWFKWLAYRAMWKGGKLDE